MIEQKQVAGTVIGTKAQQTLKLQQKQNKTERKVVSREEHEAEEERQFVLRQ
ncbi:MAG: YjdF family protein [Clostridiales bacterium]|nr:YjdF family protein [Clostridiales bacterium]